MNAVHLPIEVSYEVVSRNRCEPKASKRCQTNHEGKGFALHAFMTPEIIPRVKIVMRYLRADH